MITFLYPVHKVVPERSPIRRTPPSLLWLTFKFKAAQSNLMAPKEETGMTTVSLVDVDRSPFQRSENSWRSRALTFRALEFAVSIALLLVALLFSLIEVHDRPIPSIKVQLNTTTVYWALDPTINQQKLAEQVPMTTLVVAATCIPIAVNLLVNFVTPRFMTVISENHDTRDFLLALLQAIALSQVLTQFIKNQTGRFRPSFYDMCGWQFDKEWDGVTNLCTNASGEKEARKSFPSGHSSFSWATMVLLTLYLLGRSRLSALNRGESIARGGRKASKLFVCFVPTLVATWVALTRSIDNWHHYSDILAGSIIGAVSACVAYTYNYGYVFSWDAAGVTRAELVARMNEKICRDQEGDIATDEYHNAEATDERKSNGNWVIRVTDSSLAGLTSADPPLE